MPDERLTLAPDELAAVHDALRWAREGDLLLLLCQADRDAVLELLDNLRAAGWQPGTNLPSELIGGRK